MIVFRFTCQLTRFNSVISLVLIAAYRAFRFLAIIDLICITLMSDHIYNDDEYNFMFPTILFARGFYMNIFLILD